MNNKHFKKKHFVFEKQSTKFRSRTYFMAANFLDKATSAGTFKIKKSFH